MNENTDLGMKKFHRYYIMLRPSIIIIYDELEADHPAEWSWLLHNDSGLVIDKENNTISGENEFAHARVTLLGSATLDFQLSDQFSVKPENFTGKRDVNGNINAFGNQWHFKGVSARKDSSMRYLAIMQVKPKGNDAPTEDPANDEAIFDDVLYDEKSGAYIIGDWLVRAEMNNDEPAFIQVLNQKNGATMVSKGPLNFNGKKYKGENSGSTKILEEIDGKLVFKETLDYLPASFKKAR